MPFDVVVRRLKACCMSSDPFHIDPYSTSRTGARMVHAGLWDSESCGVAALRTKIVLARMFIKAPCIQSINLTNHSSRLARCWPPAPAAARGPTPVRAAPAADGPSSSGSDSQPSSSSSSSSWGQAWAKKARASSSSGPRKGAPIRRRPELPKRPPVRPAFEEEVEQQQRDADPELEAAIRSNVDRAAALLDEIIREVNRNMFMTEATAFLYDEQPDIKVSQAVREAVAARLDVLDGNFLAALNAYVTAARQLPPSPLSQLLEVLRVEVLAQVSEQMPPAVRVLNAALAHASRGKRLQVLRTALTGPSSSSAEAAGDDSGSAEAASSSSGTAGQRKDSAAVPVVGLEALSAAAIQLVDDMEDQQIVADRVLLARLVLLREELRATAGKRAAADMLQEAAAGAAGDASEPNSSSSRAEPGRPDPSYKTAADGGFFSYQRANLPRQCAAFLKELLGVGARDRRLALIHKAFREDWEPAGARGEQQQQGEAPDVLRPGRLLNTLHATRRELEQAYVTGTLGSGSASQQQDGGAGLIKRLDEIELECLVVLDQIQQGGGDKGQTDLAELDSQLDYAFGA